MTLGSLALITDSQPFPSLWALPPVIGTALLLRYARNDNWVAQLLSWPGFVGVGLISYSIYLWHQPLLAAVRVAALPGHASNLLLGAAAVGSILFGYLSWRFIEQPFRNRNSLLFGSRTRIFALSGAVGALFVVIGIIGITSQGLLQRYPAADRYLVTLDPLKEGSYTQAYFNSRLLADFDPNDSRTRLLIIGDSYAEDFANIIKEAGATDAFQVATFHIPTVCGNFFALPLDKSVRDASVLPRCRHSGNYGDSHLQARIATADIIVLASHWHTWHLAPLEKSLTALDLTHDAQIIVVGVKSFGTVATRRLLEIPPTVRFESRQTSSASALAIATVMREANLPGYIDLMAAACSDSGACPIFTKTGALISYDGGHLTREGSRWLAQRLIQTSPVFRSVFLMGGKVPQ